MPRSSPRGLRRGNLAHTGHTKSRAHGGLSGTNLGHTIPRPQSTNKKPRLSPGLFRISTTRVAATQRHDESPGLAVELRSRGKCGQTLAGVVHILRVSGTAGYADVFCNPRRVPRSSSREWGVELGRRLRGKIAPPTKPPP